MNKKNITKDLEDIMEEFKNEKDEQKYYNDIEFDDDSMDLMEAAINTALEQIEIKNKKN